MLAVPCFYVFRVTVATDSSRYYPTQHPETAPLQWKHTVLSAREEMNVPM